MKTIFLAITATTISALAFNNVNAQSAMNNVAMNDVRTSTNPVAKFNTANATINFKAMKDFKKSFANVNDASWEKINDGFIAEFNKDGVETTVGYDKKGNWNYEILRYDETRLPRDVRAQIKGTYYDYTITIVDEVHYLGQIVYLVHMQDQNTWKIIRVSDGAMDVYQAFNKAK